MAAIQALEFGLEVGIDQAIVEGELEIVVKALASKDSGLASFGLLVKVANVCATSYSRLAYSHTRREGNKVAHSLARLAVSISNYVVWMENVSPHIYPVFQANKAILS